MKLLYPKRYWCDTKGGKDDRKLVKAIWTHVKKVSGNTIEQCKLNGFQPSERGEKDTKK